MSAKKRDNTIFGDNAPAGGVIDYSFRSRKNKTIIHRLVINGLVMMPEEYIRALDYMGHPPDEYGRPEDVHSRMAYPRRHTTTIFWRTSKEV